MSKRDSTLLVVGATGSIGQLVVEQAVREGYTVRALVRDIARSAELSAEADRVLGDLTRPETLSEAVANVNAIVFTHGTYDGEGDTAERVDYGGVRNVLEVLGPRRARIALMTAIGVTYRESASQSANDRHDWKRRGERLVRASGLPYTIVRPGWFDYNAADQHKLVLLQGDTRTAGDPSDGVIARRQIAEVLVRSLSSDAAVRKTFELVAERGAAPERPEDFDTLFASVSPDPSGSIDGVRDRANLASSTSPSEFDNSYAASLLRRDHIDAHMPNATGRTVIALRHAPRSCSTRRRRPSEPMRSCHRGNEEVQCRTTAHSTSRRYRPTKTLALTNRRMVRRVANSSRRLRQAALPSPPCRH